MATSMGTGSSDKSTKLATPAELEKLKDVVEELKKECTEFNFLVVGKSGAGKSTLLNALTATDAFKSSSRRSEAGTKMVTNRKVEINGVTITVWDSPGFENNPENDARYKDEIKCHCSDVDVVLYCISLKEVRFNLSDDTNAIRSITEALSATVWKRAVIVFTHANVVQKRLERDDPDKAEEQFLEDIEKWRGGVHEALKEAGAVDAANIDLPVVPAGHVKKGKHLPGHKYWLSNIWFTIFNGAVAENVPAKLALARAAEGRFKKAGEETSETDIVFDNVSIAAGGTVAATSAATGATVGALIGALAIGIPSFGVAAGAGLAIGGVVGSFVGLFTGAFATAVVQTVKDLKKEKDLENEKKKK